VKRIVVLFFFLSERSKGSGVWCGVGGGGGGGGGGEHVFSRVENF
jgi:hypothetical protein